MMNLIKAEFYKFKKSKVLLITIVSYLALAFAGLLFLSSQEAGLSSANIFTIIPLFTSGDQSTLLCFCVLSTLISKNFAYRVSINPVVNNEKRSSVLLSIFINLLTSAFLFSIITISILVFFSYNMFTTKMGLFEAYGFILITMIFIFIHQTFFLSIMLLANVVFNSSASRILVSFISCLLIQIFTQGFNLFTNSDLLHYLPDSQISMLSSFDYNLKDVFIGICFTLILSTILVLISIKIFNKKELK